nr:protein breast cancer susceptibility 1 homolog [Tanacetum cinerariifolium]
LTPECKWDEDNFVMLCPLHTSRKLPNETCSSQVKEKKKPVPKRQAPIKQTQVPAVDTISAISRWDSHGLFTKVVLCCSALTSTEKETIAMFEKLSGVTILKTWDSRVTHVIASVDENGACRRTLKYLMGVIEGKWILNIEWIKACLEVKKPVDEQLYEINLDIHGFKGGPKLGRSRLLNKEPKLFNGMKFYFTGDFVASYKGQAPIKQTQVPAVDTISAISRWDSHGLFTKVVLCCSALTSTEKVR